MNESLTTGSGIVATVLLAINVALFCQSIALQHICVGYLSIPHFVLSFSITGAAILMILFHAILWPILILLVWSFVLFAVLPYPAEKEAEAQRSQEHQFYFNAEIGYDVKLHRIFSSPGRGRRLLRIQFWIFVVAAQVAAFVFAARGHVQQ